MQKGAASQFHFRFFLWRTPRVHGTQRLQATSQSASFYIGFQKHNFECAIVDHVGLDIIARNPINHELMGISVKARSRDTRTVGDPLNIQNDNLKKLEDACQAFNCKPYFALVIDEADSITAFILSQAHLVSIFPPGKAVISWKMRKANIAQYEIDPEIKTFRFSTATGNWWNEQP